MRNGPAICGQLIAANIQSRIRSKKLGRILVRRMNITRAFVLLLALTALCDAATPRAIVTVQQEHHPSELHSCGHTLTVIRQIGLWQWMATR